jgi:hypothetical protein
VTGAAKDRISQGIKTVISELMDRVIDRVLVTDPFIKEKHHSAKPLYAALVPDEIFKGSHFERRFVTPFGGVWEKLAKVVAIEAHGNCHTGHTITGNISEGSLKRIQEVLNKLEHSHRGCDSIKPDWERELNYIKNGGGEMIATSVVCDVFITSNKTGEAYSFELKAPLPNSDQTKVSKEKMFKLLVMNPPQVDQAFYALPYNPYGTKEDYAWSFPLRWFNMTKDTSVLIGDEFWDFIGGEGTYNKFITEVNSLGAGYKDRIYREFLGIEPPGVEDAGALK